jgi:menaquinone-dependent protoporphyrinogen oxidase
MKVHVITASKHGSTTGIGDAIAERLRGHSIHVVSEDAAEALPLPPRLEPVVLGSPIYMGKWLKPAHRVMEELAVEPPGRRIFMFSVGPVGDPPKPVDAVAEDEVEMFAAERAESSRMFTGRVDRSLLGALEKIALATVKAPDGDYRDWEHIHAWADEIAHRLAREPAGMR